MEILVNYYWLKIEILAINNFWWKIETIIVDTFAANCAFLNFFFENLYYFFVFQFQNFRIYWYDSCFYCVAIYASNRPEGLSEYNSCNLWIYILYWNLYCWKFPSYSSVDTPLCWSIYGIFSRNYLHISRYSFMLPVRNNKSGGLTDLGPRKNFHKNKNFGFWQYFFDTDFLKFFSTFLENIFVFFNTSLTQSFKTFFHYIFWTHF